MPHGVHACSVCEAIEGLGSTESLQAVTRMRGVTYRMRKRMLKSGATGGRNGTRSADGRNGTSVRGPLEPASGSDGGDVSDGEGGVEVGFIAQELEGLVPQVTACDMVRYLGARALGVFVECNTQHTGTHQRYNTTGGVAQLLVLTSTRELQARCCPSLLPLCFIYLTRCRSYTLMRRRA
jgi:hypothetical protein